jgi:hypothetical protein
MIKTDLPSDLAVSGQEPFVLAIAPSASERLLELALECESKGLQCRASGDTQMVMTYGAWLLRYSSQLFDRAWRSRASARR